MIYLKKLRLSTLYLVFETSTRLQEIKLFEKRNWYWYDSIYGIAAISKWLDTSLAIILYKTK